MDKFEIVGKEDNNQPKKKISVWLICLSRALAKYFGDEPTNLSLEELKKRVMLESLEVNIFDMAEIMNVVEFEYKKLQEKRGRFLLAA